MNDDRLVSLLGSLRGERMDRTADQKLRQRLENAWTGRAIRGGLLSRLRRPVLAVATAALMVGSVIATLGAPGDSPLYALRVTLEDLAIPLHADPEDRAEYLVSLLEQRTAEAARLEATGNALAASSAREIERRTLRMVQQNLPTAPEVVEAAPTESPTPSPTPTPTPTPAPDATQPATQPTTTQPPGLPRPATAPPAVKPAATPTPRPATAATPQAVTFTGTVKNPDGTLAHGVCVSLSAGGFCHTVSNQGSFRLTFSAKIGQSVTLYFQRWDATKTYKASITKIVSSTHVEVGTVTLKFQ